MDMDATTAMWLTMLVTLVIAIANVVLVLTTRRQVRASERSSAAALRGVEESWKSRIDSTAPRVIGYPVPGVGALLHGAQDANARSNLDGSRVFNVAQEPGRLIEITLKAQWKNDGATTALVRFGGDLELTDTAHRRRTADYHERAVIPPGDIVVTRLSIVRTLKEWTDLYEANQTFEPTPEQSERPGTANAHAIIFDEFDEGVVDHVHVTAFALPMGLVPNNPGRWRLRDITGAARPILRVHPVERDYYRSRIRDEPAGLTEG